MAKFRKKPTEGEAWQWDGNAAADARPDWVLEELKEATG
jgi:hypothetical protein